MGIFSLKEEEIRHARELLNREPNDVEWSVISVIWSEHCSYKHSKKYLKDFLTKADWVEQGPGENAGIVSIGDGYKIVFKIESHNHPSAVEPFQGAATGIGGIVRDILALGARPIALLDSLRFGPLDKERNKYLFNGVVGGISFYGNCIGVPVVGGEIAFEDCYSANPLINVMCVGIIPPDRKVYKGRAEGKGNLLLLVGARTGRDGLQGASFASEKLDDEYHRKRPSVQVGDPFLGKLLIEACVEAASYDGIVGIQDLGAAGLVSALSESARRGGSGVKVYLEKVPQREEEMTPQEILLSESQERMLFIVKPEKIEEIKAIFKKWDLEAEVIGEVIEEEKFTIYHNGEKVVDLPTELLVDEALTFDPLSTPYSFASSEQIISVKKEDISKFINNVKEEMKLKETIYRQYDYSVQTNTILPPGFGDAAVLRIKGTNKGIAITNDGNGRYSFLNPKHGGMCAVAESCRNILCVGGKPLAITDGLNFGDPDEADVFYQFKEVVKGINIASRILEIPVISGNVSFYNGQGDNKVFPTPVIGMVGVLEDLDYLIVPGLKNEGNPIYLIGDFSWLTLDGSKFIKDMYGIVKGNPSYIDLVWERKIKLFMEDIRKKKLIVSAHDVSEGGIFCTLFEMAFWGKKGLEVFLPEDSASEKILFGEGSGLIILEIDKSEEEAFIKFANEYEIKLQKLGRDLEDKFIMKPYFESSLEDLLGGR